jgi:hypothetical protein
VSSPPTSIAAKLENQLSTTVITSTFATVDSNGRSTVVTTSFTSTMYPPTSTATSTKFPISSTSSGLSNGALAGVIVGTILVALAIIAGLYFVVRNKRRRDKHDVKWVTIGDGLVRLRSNDSDEEAADGASIRTNEIRQWRYTRLD